MGVDGRLERLRRDHAECDRRIAAEQKRPAPDWTEITGLKRRKLALKESLLRAAPPDMPSPRA